MQAKARFIVGCYKCGRSVERLRVERKAQCFECEREWHKNYIREWKLRQETPTFLADIVKEIVK